MASTKPRILIFDDNKDWVQQIATAVRGRCDPHTVHAIEHWERALGGEYWDALIMDVDIAGSETTGTDRAEQAILEYKITSPIIVVSGVWALDEVKKRHPGIFFDYIHKDNLNDCLPESINRACSIAPRTNHVRTMLTSFAQKFGILKKGFTLELLPGREFRQMYESVHGETIGDLIGLIEPLSRKYLDRIGKAILTVIDDISGKSA